MKKKNVFKTGFKIPSTVKFQHKQNLLFLKGPIGSVCLSISFFKNRTASLTSKKIKASSFYRLLQKAIVGVFLGFVVRLAFVGVGFRVESIENSFIKLKLGFSHFVFVKIPPYILVFSPHKTTLILKSLDEQLLKEFCSKICFFRVPDVYKGKGILYKNQQLTLKEGKKK
jgi:large subunit ribosomal protein L6|tara:strand:- start:3344 stop:3853 length:510 start_codon:yes stop_codon:yes gene_type:complete